MSLAEIVNELPKLNHRERRELARRIFEVEDEETVLLADCDRATSSSMVAVQALLDLIKKRLLKNGIMPPVVGLATMCDPANVETISQQDIQGAPREWLSTCDLAGPAGPYFGKNS